MGSGVVDPSKEGTSPVVMEPASPAHQRTRPVVAAVAALLVAVGALVACSSGGSAAKSTTTTSSASTSTGGASGDGAGTPYDAVPALVQRLEPSVVSVRVRSATGTAEGSGVIVRSDGVIVTNHHVVSSGEKVAVTFADGTTVAAEQRAADPATDLAILQVDRRHLPAAELADTYPEIGQFAAAIGNPLGFENSVTVGVVSGLGRSLPSPDAQEGQALVDLIQTDAAISPGNSGGALISSDGSVIGISVAYAPPTTGAVSLGFAIPAPTVADVVHQLLTDGSVAHPFVGVQLASVTSQIAQRFDLGTDAGALIMAVEAGGPAEGAGVRRGDIVTAVDGHPVRGVGDFLTQLRHHQPGDDLPLRLRRGSGARTITVHLGDRPAG